MIDRLLGVAADGFQLPQSLAAGCAEHAVSCEGRGGCLVWCRAFNDLQRGLGQPKRMRQQCSIWKVGQPYLKLKHQVVE